MISSYFISQILQAKKLKKKFLLVIGTGNCSEINRGYFSKYDNSSGDINLIGDLCKQDVYNMLRFFLSEGAFYYSSKANRQIDKQKFLFFNEIISTQPTAELRPAQENEPQEQVDEQDMGLSYKDLDYLLKLRKQKKMGFKSMALAFIEHNLGRKSEKECIELVTKFYRYYCQNRHKVATLPPGVHLSDFSAENDRFDRRPLFYASNFDFEKKMLQKELLKRKS
jgi:NAD+ synthase (glutamine-hydrolysing)